MIFAISDIDWMMGLAIMFGLSMIMTALTIKKTSVFFIWLTIFSAFAVWSSLIELWVLVLCIIALVLIVISQLRSRGRGT